MLFRSVDRVPVSGGAVTAVSSGPAVGGGYTVVSAVARQGLPAALAATLGTGPNSSQVRQAMMLDGVELVVEELVGDIGTYTTLFHGNRGTERRPVSGVGRGVFRGLG